MEAPADPDDSTLMGLAAMHGINNIEKLPHRNELELNMPKSLVALLIVAMAHLIAGCASPWQQFYRSNPAAKGMKFAPTPNAEVRTIPFERFQSFATDLKSRMVNSSVAPQDWSPDEKVAVKNRLFETLQIKERGNDAGLIGWSEFWHTQILDPYDGKLCQFAQKIGADYAVVTSAYGGQFTQTVAMPLTSFFSTSFYNTRGYSGGAVASETTYVPTQVTRDRYIYEVLFVRKLTAAENRALGR